VSVWFVEGVITLISAKCVKTHSGYL